MLSSSDDEEKVKQPLLKRPHRSRTSPAAAPPTLISNLKILAVAAVGALALLQYGPYFRSAHTGAPTASLRPAQHEIWQETVSKCEELGVLPGVPNWFASRTQSDRYVEGTPPLLVRNASVWTGEQDGHEVLYNTDVLLDRGLIVKIGEDLQVEKEYKVIDAHGAFLTPGIFDLHGHAGVDSLPGLSGASDTNSVQGATLPHLRSLDAHNGHDLAFRRIAAGGITTMLVLPGSANNIGGQAFALKLRPTAEKTILSRTLELPWNVKNPNGERKKRGDPPRWRHMKMACGENIRRVYGQTRLDLAWNFRSAFEEARKLKLKQDSYCARALSVHEKGEVLLSSTGEVEEFPHDLKTEALVDVLRGKVLVQNHCYETTDLDMMIRLTHEFEFPISAFHHAHEAFLVPDLLKQAWPGNGTSTPAVALFGTNGLYKREAWRGSPYAGKVLAENNISVVYKSDHPVTDSRYLPFQAQQAHHFGLPSHLALSSITTTPARVAGLSHRVGFIRPNYDADVVLWSVHPLSLGATPRQVVIDGIVQLLESHPPRLGEGGTEAQRNGPESASLPRDYDPPREQEDDGFEWANPGEGRRKKGTEVVERVKFVDVGETFLPSCEGVGLEEAKVEGLFEIVVEDGRVVCLEKSCEGFAGMRTVDLKGGSLLPALVSTGTALGLAEIVSEKSTLDGSGFDPLFQGGLSATQQAFALSTPVKAIDGLAFGGKHLKVAEEAGVGKAVTFPQGDGFSIGVSTAFRTSAANVLEQGAVLQEVTALHVRVGHGNKGTPSTPSISTQIAYLRSLLLAPLQQDSDERSSTSFETDYFSLVTRGKLPLVVHTDKADIIAGLINLKKQVEEESGRELRLIIHGAAEAWLLVRELAAAKIAVILTPVRAFPETWDERRGLPGPPLTRATAVEMLHEAGVKLALGVQEEYQVRGLLWEAAWAQKLTEGRISRKEAVEFVSTNLEEMFRIDTEQAGKVEFVAFERDPFEFGSRLVAASTADGRVKLFL
ncbi:hypothetical protein JCM8547_004085 [Rhodosporidiobolus lusitaniae]